jgi:hypothetical protein
MVAPMFIASTGNSSSREVASTLQALDQTTGDGALRHAPTITLPIARAQILF